MEVCVAYYYWYSAGSGCCRGIGFYFFFWKKKHNSVSLEQLNTDKGNDVQMAMMDKNNP